MPFRSRGTSRDAIWRLAIVFVIGLAGCQPAEQVSRYTAPKDPIDLDTISDDSAEGEPEVRIVGAIAEAGKPGEESWYVFKFQPGHMGGTYSPKAIERHKGDFDAFIDSLKFPEGRPTWVLPAKWREVEVKTMIQRLATFRMKKSATVVDLAVTDAKGGLLENINRWREQHAGIGPITQDEIETKFKVLTIDGRKVVVVDVSGPGIKNPHGK